MSFADLFPYKVNFRANPHDSLTFIWLLENVGLANYSYGEGTYFFKHQKHAVMFTLRWV